MQPYNGYGAYDDPEDNENEDEEHEEDEPVVEQHEDEEESEEDEEENGEGSEDDDDEEEDEQDAEGEEDEEDHDDEEDASGEEDDEEMAVDVEEDGDDAGSPTSAKPSKPLPPNLARRALFHPPFHPFSPLPSPSTLSVEALIAIPHPCATYSLALPSCSSMLLTGSADGHVRSYDLWASANGGMPLTSAQKTATGLGESVNRGGVPKGWWVNAGIEEEDEDAEGEEDVDADTVAEKKKPAPMRRPEAVHSMVSQCDALWCLTGTQSGMINLTTLRHSPGSIVHTLKGHVGPVAALALSPDETALLSGGWDSTLKEWDLNTGQVIRTYPHLGTQLSSVSFRPHWPASATADVDSVPVSVAPSATPGDVPMVDAEADAASNASYDPLFDDADEDVPPVPSAILASGGTPGGLSFPPPGSGSIPKLALPGSQPAPSKPLALPNGNTPKFANAAPSVPPARAAPSLAPLSHESYRAFSDDVVLTSAMDGNVVLIDRRVKSYESGGVGRLLAGDKAPPWCMSATWSADGTLIYAGRRNGTIDIWDVRRSLASSTSTTPNLLTSLRTPAESGPVSAVVAFSDGKHMACGSQDNIRLWNPAQIMRDEQSSFAGKKKSSRPPFKIIAGHHGGIVSSLVVDPTNRFLISASGDRGWQGESTKVVLVHEIKW